MAFTLHPKPDHVHRAACPDDCDEAHVHMELCVRGNLDPACLDHHWIGGRPAAEHTYHLEHDVSTGMTGYTKWTEAELAERDSRAAEEVIQQLARDAILRERQDVIRKRAKDDPAFKALAEHLGIPLDD